MAQPFCSWPFRLASTPCPVGGLGGRAEGCVEHIVLSAVDLDVRKICRVPSLRSEVTKGFHAPARRLLCPLSPPVCPGAHEQTHGRDAALCSVAPRFLAAPALAPFL